DFSAARDIPLPGRRDRLPLVIRSRRTRRTSLVVPIFYPCPLTAQHPGRYNQPSQRLPRTGRSQLQLRARRDQGLSRTGTRCKVLLARRRRFPLRTFDKLSVRCSLRESRQRPPRLVLREILSYVTLATQRSNGAAHLRYRWQWQQCGRFPLATGFGNGGEI